MLGTHCITVWMDRTLRYWHETVLLLQSCFAQDTMGKTSWPIGIRSQKNNLPWEGQLIVSKRECRPQWDFGKDTLWNTRWRFSIGAALDDSRWDRHSPWGLKREVYVHDLGHRWSPKSRESDLTWSNRRQSTKYPSERGESLSHNSCPQRAASTGLQIWGTEPSIRCTLSLEIWSMDVINNKVAGPRWTSQYWSVSEPTHSSSWSRQQHHHATPQTCQACETSDHVPTSGRVGLGDHFPLEMVW